MSSGTDSTASSRPTAQPGILDEDKVCHWVQQYRVLPAVDVAALRRAIGEVRGIEGDPRGCERVVVAFGSSLLGTLAPDAMPAGARPFTEVVGVGGTVFPSTQDDLLVWFASATADRNLSSAWLARVALGEVAELREETPGFQYFDHLDLTGFEDGTENPKGEDRDAVAFLSTGDHGAGGSFVLAQRWVHDLAAFERLPTAEQEATFGRTKDGSVELDPLPDGCHVERVVMEDDSGDEREIYRRSFPYGDTSELGLFFLAFSADHATFHDMLERMSGAADGTRDRLLSVSQPVSGAYYVAPSAGDLDRICSD